MKLSDFMRSEHAYLDELWGTFISEKDHKYSEALFKQFASALLQHMRLEDEVLQPIVSQYLGVNVNIGPAAMANRDHASLMKLLEKIEYALQNDPKRLTYEATHFRRH